jgi:hypothetical protein
MRRGIVHSEIRFDFDDAPRENRSMLAADENLPQQFIADDTRIAVVELPRHNSAIFLARI